MVSAEAEQESATRDAKENRIGDFMFLGMIETAWNWIGRLVGYFCPVLTADGKLDCAPK